MSEEKTKKPPFKERLADHLAEYGPIALLVWLSLAALVFLGFFVAIRTGFKSTSSTGLAGQLFAAWVGIKVTMPIRVFLTLILTPIIASLWHRRSHDPGPEEEAETNAPE